MGKFGEKDEKLITCIFDLVFLCAVCISFTQSDVMPQCYALSVRISEAACIRMEILKRITNLRGKLNHQINSV